MNVVKGKWECWRTATGTNEINRKEHKERKGLKGILEWWDEIVGRVHG